MKLQFCFKDFIFGVLTGLFFCAIAWSYTAYFHIQLSFIQEVLGISVATLTFGITAGIIGIQKLLDNIPNINL